MKELMQRGMTMLTLRTAVTILSLWLALLLGAPMPVALALPSVNEIMDELKLSDSDKQDVRAGKIVDWKASEGSDRELALGMAFLIKIKIEDLAEMYREVSILREVSVITAHGQLTGQGSMADLAGVELKPNPDKEAERYLEVKPGDVLNLDAKEMAAFRALKSAAKNGDVPVKEVEKLIRQGLLERYQAYRAKGLAGIAPYERGNGQRRAGDELALSTKELTGVAKHLPAFHKFLLNYPNGLPKEEAKNFEEFFHWLNIDVFGRPTYVLVHRMLYHLESGAAIAVERQYYASHDYNSMLQGMAAMPTKEGTFMFYVGRVSTDQVGGFGSSAKHPISRAITAPYIKDMFKTVQDKAAKH